MPFSDIPHQKVVTGQLAGTIRLNRLAHAYLFKGDRSSGKLLTAIALAQAVNCEKFHELGDACGQCDSCRRFESMSHPDLHHIKPESRSRKITIEQMRELNRVMNQKPVIAVKKIGIIEDADCLGSEASNAFLKTLEEPPLNCLLLLLTAHPEKLLDTIIARCQRLQFSSVTRGESSVMETMTLDFLAGHSKEKANVFELYQGLTLIFKELDTRLQEYKNKISQETGQEKWVDIAEKSYFKRVDEEIEAQVQAQRRLEREVIVKTFYQWYRDLLMIQSGADECGLNYPDYQKCLLEKSERLSGSRLLRDLQVIEKLIDDLENTNVPEALAFEVAILKLG